MSDRPLSQISADNAVDAYSVLTSAYRQDPVHRWIYPDDDGYARDFPQLVAALADGSFETRTAWRLEAEPAVALWAPPGSSPDGERVGRVLFDTVPADKHDATLATLEQADAARPTYPHWYLPWFGVESSKQGQGLGTRLLTACLEYIDLGGSPAYLLAPNPRNVPFFERFGFVVVRYARDGSAPALAAMIREGRAQ